jgi:hypothetical protein
MSEILANAPLSMRIAACDRHDPWDTSGLRVSDGTIELRVESVKGDSKRIEIEMKVPSGKSLRFYAPRTHLVRLESSAVQQLIDAGRSVSRKRRLVAATSLFWVHIMETAIHQCAHELDESAIEL